ncbi:MAG: hypothetical protein QOC98_369 [Frankiaceae bacterium]|nr:hypothetical protein [Frankiaceae bacterium]
MSPLAVAYALQFLLFLPVILGGVWSWHRYSAPLLLDALDADEMVVGAVHRLTTATYVLLALSFAVVLTPDQNNITASVIHNWASFVLCLGIANALVLRSLLRQRRRREAAKLSPRVWGPTPVSAPTSQASPPFGTPPRCAPRYFAPPPAYAAPFYSAPPTHFSHRGHAAPANTAGPNPWAWPPPYPAPRRR